MTDIFAIQSEVALQIASALETELSPAEHRRVRRKPTDDLQAYHLFLQGRQLLGRYTTDAMLGSLAFFARAIARDPEFADAHASLAIVHAQLAEMGVFDPASAYPRAAEAVDLALRLDPDLDTAHCTLGFLKAVREYDWVGAEREFERALELNPSGADTYDLYGRVCAGIERYDQAIALLERAGELDPLSHRDRHHDDTPSRGPHRRGARARRGGAGAGIARARACHARLGVLPQGPARGRARRAGSRGGAWLPDR